MYYQTKMSHLLSTKLSRSQYTVAIAGATGNLGSEICRIFLTEYRPFFSRVLGLVRNTSSPTALSLAAEGAELHQFGTSNDNAPLVKLLEGVDVVVNILPTTVTTELKNALFDAALKGGAKVYFPSEFGVDHRLNDFPGFDHSDWTHKRTHVAEIRQAAEDKLKVVAVYVGLFLEDSIGPWFGFDTASNSYTCVGEPTQRITFTAKSDIGRSLAELALIALSPVSSARVRDDLRIAGSVASFADVRDIAERVRAELDVGAKGIELKTEDLASFRERTRGHYLADPTISPADHLRILMAEGKLDYSGDNANEIVNPAQSIWKWKTVEDYIREVKGKPWC
ncbi:putative pinoresinol-lariciresinol reductase 3 [Grifola frondosa]|uniref:Putative pinoresinol-lariciresinol reductase 3 n=1 Tax=Grifola frondosa TaxID=5627 RepID=A0A1C7LRM7_GRIFR|nr:putative pinoresinol-lariciresinol reductase 3 [Grifola frondosa]